MELKKISSIFLVFKLTTCFGLYFRPSSGHKTYIIGGCYTV